MSEHRRQVGIGPGVEDQEAGVHRVANAFQRHVHRVGVTTGRRPGLVQRHLVFLPEKPGAGETGNPRADYGNSLHTVHVDLLVLRRAHAFSPLISA